ncbi:unnamed protein product [Peniophora sp. CBMAI 1063]|nr:unnamed protein product [Peniophora sp. CBMAI 1063]
MRRIGSGRVYALMFGTLLTALVVIITHHVFLLILDGRGVDTVVIPQTWVRDVGNALARLVQLFLETSVGVALTQSIWFYVLRSAVDLPELDALFSLPSLLSLPSLSLRLSTLYVLLLVINVQAFSLVSILAPNALSVVPAHRESSTLSIPFPALDMIPITQSVIPDVVSHPCSGPSNDPRIKCGIELVYASPSTGIQKLVEAVLSSSAALPWSAPAGCGIACNYTLTYDGPALRCSDIPQSSIDIPQSDDDDPTLHNADAEPGAYIQTGTVYNATTTMGYIQTLDDDRAGPVFVPTATNSPYTLTLAYATNPFSNNFQPTYDAHGSYCVFVNATYSASVSFMNGSQTVSARVQRYHEPYQSLLTGFSANSTDDPSIRSSYATLGLIDSLSRYLAGSVTYFKGYNLVTSSTQILESALFTVNWTYSPEHLSNHSISISPALGRNVSEALQDICTNLTLSLMSDTADLNIRKPAMATVLPDTNIYEYNASRLWLVYGIALAAALVADLFGLMCMRLNGGAMQRTFSTIAASTRGRELDELLSGPDQPLPAAAKVAKLRYRGGMSNEGERSGFRVIGDQAHGEIEMVDTATLNGECP